MTNAERANPVGSEMSKQPLDVSAQRPARPQHHRLFGVDAAALTIDEVLGQIAESVDRRTRLTMFTQNLHSAYLQQRNPLLRRSYECADVSYIDGMPFVVHGRLLRYGESFNRSHRTTYLDWYERFYEMAEQEGWRIYYLGGTEESLERGLTILRERFPHLVTTGRQGYFDSSGVENGEVLAAVNQFRPDVLMVGMGMPRQEMWIANNRERLVAPAVVTVGAGNDYVAGVTPAPPRWMGRVGLEWLYRLCAEPRRLWRRYLVEPIFLVPVLFRELWNAWRPPSGSARTPSHIDERERF